MSTIKIVKTNDGSDTLFSERFNAYYHSTNGALQESMHIFIENGFDYINKTVIKVLEVGFGTGLNAALTASKSQIAKKVTHYTGIELYPPDPLILSKINYGITLPEDNAKNWKLIVESQWNVEVSINECFSLKKIHGDFIRESLNGTYDLIYFDAFAPDDQPEMWDIPTFDKLFKHTSRGGVLVTYCSKGIVKQALRTVGYKVERLPGPIGKRHMVRAERA